MEEWPSSPHKPVCLRMSIPVGHRWQRVQRQPWALPQGLPIGCAPPPAVWPQARHDESCQEQCNLTWHGIMFATETEVLNLHGIAEEDRYKYYGRGLEAKWVLKPL
eukprot:5517599-Karenia_brevis.AAC.1